MSIRILKFKGDKSVQRVYKVKCTEKNTPRAGRVLN